MDKIKDLLKTYKTETIAICSSIVVCAVAIVFFTLFNRGSWASKDWVYKALENYKAQGTLTDEEIKAVSTEVSYILQDKGLQKLGTTSGAGSTDLTDEDLRSIVLYIDNSVAKACSELPAETISDITMAVTKELVQQYSLSKPAELTAKYEKELANIEKEIKILKTNSGKQTISDSLTRSDVLKMLDDLENDSISGSQIQNWIYASNNNIISSYQQADENILQQTQSNIDNIRNQLNNEQTTVSDLQNSLVTVQDNISYLTDLNNSLVDKMNDTPADTANKLKELSKDIDDCLAQLEKQEKTIQNKLGKQLNEVSQKVDQTEKKLTDNFDDLSDTVTKFTSNYGIFIIYAEDVKDLNGDGVYTYDKNFDVGGKTESIDNAEIYNVSDTQNEKTKYIGIYIHKDTRTKAVKPTDPGQYEWHKYTGDQVWYVYSDDPQAAGDNLKIFKEPSDENGKAYLYMGITVSQIEPYSQYEANSITLTQMRDAYTWSKIVGSGVYIKYADDDPIKDVTQSIYDTPTKDTRFVGIHIGTEKEAPTSASEYIWSKYIGDSVYIVYADDVKFESDNITPKSVTGISHEQYNDNNLPRLYMGVAVTQVDPGITGDAYKQYTWSKTVGDTLYIRYAEDVEYEDEDTGKASRVINSSAKPTASSKYIGTIITTVKLSSEIDDKDYEWRKYVGDQVWYYYSDVPNPTSLDQVSLTAQNTAKNRSYLYMGIATYKVRPALDSGLWTWSKVSGDSVYVKYAMKDTPADDEMSDNPTGMYYMGVARVELDPFEVGAAYYGHSYLYECYQWSKMTADESYTAYVQDDTITPLSTLDDVKAASAPWISREEVTDWTKVTFSATYTAKEEYDSSELNSDTAKTSNGTGIRTYLESVAYKYDAGNVNATYNGSSNTLTIHIYR